MVFGVHLSHLGEPRIYWLLVHRNYQVTPSQQSKATRASFEVDERGREDVNPGVRIKQLCTKSCPRPDHSLTELPGDLEAPGPGDSVGCAAGLWTQALGLHQFPATDALGRGSVRVLYPEASFSVSVPPSSLKVQGPVGAVL